MTDDKRPSLGITPQDIERLLKESLRDAVHTEAAAAMVAVLTGRSATEATPDEMRDVFTSYRDCVDQHLRNEAARAGITAAVTFLDGCGVFPHALTQEIVRAFHALNDGEAVRIAVESPTKRRGAGTQYDYTARWFASEVMIIRAVSKEPVSANLALQMLTGVKRVKDDKVLPKDWLMAPMPRGTNFGFVFSLFKRGEDLLKQRGSAARRDVEIAIEAIKRGEPCPVDGFGEIRATMQNVFADRMKREAWLRAIGATGGRKRRLGTKPDAAIEPEG